MSFDKFGFLGTQIEEISEQIYRNNLELFDLCYDLNHFAQKVKFEFSIDSNNGQQVVEASLFIKVLHGFQSAVLLFKYGLASDGKVIVRSIMETMFTLKAICDNEDSVREYILSDNVKREKLLNVIKSEKDEDIFSTVKREITLELEDSLRGDNNTTPRALQKYIMENENGSLTLECGPSTEDISPTLITALITLLISLDSLCNLFSVNHSDELSRFESFIGVSS